MQGASLGAGGIGAIGALMQGQNTSDTLKYQAQIQTNNANDALVAASINANRNQIMAQKVIGEASAGYGASGVEASSGSVLSVMSASAANAELDRQNILYGGEIRAINARNQAHLDTIGAGNAVTASYFNALSGFAGGAVRGIGNTGGGGSMPQQQDDGVS